MILPQSLTRFKFDLVKHSVQGSSRCSQANQTIVAETITADLSNEFLSSARVLAWSVREVIERTVLREVSGDKLTFSQLKLLYLVAHTDVLSIGDAAAFLGVTCGAVSRAVDKLVRRRLLRRVAPQEDRRTDPAVPDRDQPQADGCVPDGARPPGQNGLPPVCPGRAEKDIGTSGPSGGRHRQRWLRSECDLHAV